MISYIQSHPKMKHSLFLLLVLSLFVVSFGKWADCPPPHIIAPCECVSVVSTRWSWFCSDIPDTNTLTLIFQNASAYLKDDVQFHSLSLTYNDFNEIPENTFQNFRFKFIHIVYNTNLTYISPEAFDDASRNISHGLSIVANGPMAEANIIDFSKAFRVSLSKICISINLTEIFL